MSCWKTARWVVRLVPREFSTGSGEALDLRDGGEAFGGYDVQCAVANVNTNVRAVRVMDAANQAALDARLDRVR